MLSTQDLSNIITSPIEIISTSDIELKSKVGLSSKKVQYLKDLSTRVVEQKLDLDLLSTMSDEEVINQLIQVKGIGRWTAEMFDILLPCAFSFQVDLLGVLILNVSRGFLELL